MFKRLWSDCSGKPNGALVIQKVRDHKTVVWPSPLTGIFAFWMVSNGLQIGSARGRVSYASGLLPARYITLSKGRRPAAVHHRGFSADTVWRSSHSGFR